MREKEHSISRMRTSFEEEKDEYLKVMERKEVEYRGNLKNKDKEL
jgi:hypothetical protein